MGISSITQIYNLALNACGERSNISLPTENSRRAEVCNLWYEPVLEQVLSAAPWPEATKILYAAETAEKADGDWLETEPRPGYQYAYSLPADCLRPQYLADFTKFQISVLGDIKVLNTNTFQAILVYTANITNISLWSAELRMAIVYALSAHVCMAISGKPTRTKMLIDRANQFILDARISAANESTEQYEALPEWISGRGFSDPNPQKYIYPLGSLLSYPSFAVNA